MVLKQLERSLVESLINIVLVDDQLNWRAGVENTLVKECEKKLFELGYMDLDEDGMYIWNGKSEGEYGELIGEMS